LIPGKKYKPEDFVEIAWRRRWIIAAPLVVFAFATAITVQFLPDRYRSEALVLVVPPRVPSTLVKPTVTGRLEERLSQLTQRILSRTQLERVIDDFNLYPGERKTLLMDEIVERMKTNDVKVAVAKPKGRKAEVNNFSVSFESGNPRTAQQVAERLASLFVNAHLEERELQSASTSQFMQAQLDDARKRLQEQESRLEAYKRSHVGELPSQMQSNVHVLESTQTQLQQLGDTMNKEQDRRLVLEKTIAEAESVTIQQPGAKGEDLANASPQQQLEAARNALRNLETRLKPDHPDVIRAKRLVSDLEKKVDADALDQPLSPGSTKPRVLNPQEGNRQATLVKMRAELENLDRRLASQQQEQKRLEAVINTYRARIEAAPVRESELAQLNRDHEAMTQSYQGLLKKAEESNMAASMEQRQIGEQFRIVDPPRIPEKPTSPDRVRLTLFGTLGGLLLGLGLAVLIEYRDTSVRTEEDVMVALALPVAALVPTMRTAAERMKSRRRRVLVASSAAATVCIGVLAVAWKLRLFENWIR
jgi:polysaccharide chain length determinant protein (PEP-CTERM system associated)